MPGQYRHQGEDQRQFTVRRTAEIEPHRERIEHFGPCDLGIILAMIGTSLVAQQSPGEQHVVGEYGLAIRETSFGIEAEGDVTPGIIRLDGFGQQAIQREGLVNATRHKALKHEPSFERKPPDLLHGDAPDNEGVEAIESSEHAFHQPAALRRIGIGVGHMGEIGRQGRRTVHRDRVALAGLRRTGEHGRKQDEGERNCGRRTTAGSSKG
jgi:hypothetical protein